MYSNMMDEHGSQTVSDRDASRPDRTEAFAAGPVLTERQAETIAALDSHSRQGAAALLDISPSTVDDHRQDGQARVIAAIRQLCRLLDDSATIRSAVDAEFGSRPIQIGTVDRPDESAFPNMSTEKLIEEVPSTKHPDALTVSRSVRSRQRHTRRRWKAAFVAEYGDAERVEVLDEATGDRIAVGALPLSEVPLDSETIPVRGLRDAELLDWFLDELRQALVSVDQPFEFRRID